MEIEAYLFQETSFPKDTAALVIIGQKYTHNSSTGLRPKSWQSLSRAKLSRTEFALNTHTWDTMSSLDGDVASNIQVRILPNTRICHPPT